MYVIGFIDDEESVYKSYRRKFSFYNRKIDNEDEKISFIQINIKNNFTEIVDQILNEHIECVLIDNKMTTQKGENLIGAELLKFINSTLVDLPCIMLTSWVLDAEDTELVYKPMIYDKEIMTKELDSIEFKDFIKMIEHCIKVFRKRKELDYEIYLKLFEKYSNNKLDNSKEYEELTSKHRLLVAYNLIENVPIEALNAVINDKLDNIIDDLEKLLEE